MKHDSSDCDLLIEEINKDLDGHAELQIVVNACIAEYKANKEIADAAQSALGELVAATKASRKRGAEDEATAVDVEFFLPRGELRRGQTIFGKWNAKHLDIVLPYIEPSIDVRCLKRMPLENKRQMVEMALEIKWFGDELGRVATTDRYTLCPKLKRVYTLFRTARLQVRRD